MKKDPISNFAAATLCMIPILGVAIICQLVVSPDKQEALRITTATALAVIAVLAITGLADFCTPLTTGKDERIDDQTDKEDS